jgi:hypothetical protein
MVLGQAMPPTRRSTLPAALAVLGATFVGVLVHEADTTSSRRTAAPTIDVAHRPAPHPAAPPASAVTTTVPVTEAPRATGPLGRQDGLVPKGTTVFADVPAVTGLDPALRSALQRAASEAAADRVTILVTSGWRSPRYQAHLLRAAVAKYGSAEAAARWVASPERSQHVAGKAVDVGPAAALTWLSKHGAAYGLCQIYANERWHYELRPDAVAHGCPAMYADPAHDPRLQA